MMANFTTNQRDFSAFAHLNLDKIYKQTKYRDSVVDSVDSPKSLVFGVHSLGVWCAIVVSKKNRENLPVSALALSTASILTFHSFNKIKDHHSILVSHIG